MKTRTPIFLASFSAELVSYATLPQVSDTFRVLRNSMDFSEDDGDGWQVLDELCSSAVLAGKDPKAAHDLLLWMLQLSRFELRANVTEGKYADMLYWVFQRETVLAGVADLLFSLGGSSIIDAVSDYCGGYPLLHDALARAWEEDEVRVLVERGACLQQQYFSDEFTPYEESPTSLAMYSSRAFTYWLHAMVKIKIDFESFIDQELEQNPELHAGWEKETLLELFTHGDRPDLHFEQPCYCSDCKTRPECCGPFIQPYWRSLLERIKGRLQPYEFAPAYPELDEDDNADFCSVGEATSCSTDLGSEIDTTEDGPPDSLDKVSSESKPKDETSEHSAMIHTESECLYGKHEVVCINCWIHFQRTGTRYQRDSDKDSAKNEDSSSSYDSSECEYSPFLIHR